MTVPEFARGLDVGQHRAPCPACNHGPRDDALSITVEPDGGGVWTCHRCHVAGNWSPPPNGRRRPIVRAVAKRRTQDFALIFARAADEDGSHPYLQRKCVRAYPGVRREIDGRLVVAMYAAGGAICGLQRIAADGSKQYAPGSRKVGALFPIGRPQGDVPTLVVAEGYATGASVHEATGLPVVVAFDRGNLEPAAWRVREKMSAARIIFAADNDIQTEGNPGLTDATAAARAVGGLVALPPPGDFNDFACAAGADAVRACIDAAAAPEPVPVPLEESRSVESEAMPWPLPGMTLGADQRPHMNEANAAVLLRAAFAHFPFHYDTFRSTIIAPDGSLWSDEWDTRALMWVQQHRLATIKASAVRSAVRLIADERKRDSLRDYLAALEWDGVDRIESALIEAWGAADTRFIRAASRSLFISLAARAETPGAQVDQLYVFEGPQGIKKSSSLRMLGGDLHGELSTPLGSPDQARQVQGKWIVELAEMRSLGGVAVETLRDSLTRRSDSRVPKYREHSREVPRRYVFVATTNARHYWSDLEGARRLVPIKCGHIDLSLIEANREQWFAEGVWRYRHGEAWHLFPGAEVERAERQSTGAWDETIGAWLVGRTECTVRGVMVDAIGFADSTITRRAENDAADVLRRLGWESTPQRRGPAGVRVRMWVAAPRDQT